MDKIYPNVCKLWIIQNFFGEKIIHHAGHFCKSMEDRGKIVENRIIESGRNYKFIYEKLDVTRHTLRNWLDTPNLEWDKIMRIGKIIHHDFSIDFPELREIASQVYEPEMIYGQTEALRQCQEQLRICTELVNYQRDKIKMLEAELQQQRRVG